MEMVENIKKENGKTLKESRKDVENFGRDRVKSSSSCKFFYPAPLLEQMDGSRINWMEI